MSAPKQPHARNTPVSASAIHIANPSIAAPVSYTHLRAHETSDDISRRDAIRYLRRLDRMNIIELQPGDRARLLIASNFAWRKNGAIEQFFNQHVQSEFFNHHFRDDRSIRIVKNGMLSRKSQRQLLDKLRAIGELFDDTIWEERKLPARDKLGTSMVLAVRHSYFRAFRELERQAGETSSRIGR